MPNLGVDYSFARIPASQIKSSGYTFVGRYLATSSGKRITTSEVTDLQNNGIALVLVFEDNANQALNGNAQGVADAQEALSQANSIGWASSRPIYFAVDFDATPAQQSAIDAYFDGVASVIGHSRVGAYGGYWVIKRLFDNGKITFGWQTLAWSGGNIDSRIHLYQNGQSAFNGNADVDEAKQTDYGQSPIQGENMYPTEASLQLLTAQTGWQKGLDGKTQPNAIAYWCDGTGNPDWADSNVVAAKWAIEVFYAGRTEGEALAKASAPATPTVLPNLVSNVPSTTPVTLSANGGSPAPEPGPAPGTITSSPTKLVTPAVPTPSGVHSGFFSRIMNWIRSL